MEYQRIYPKLTPQDNLDVEVSFLSKQISSFRGDDCGAKIIGVLYSRDYNADEHSIRKFEEQYDAMILTTHVYSNSLSLWFIGFGSEEAEMLAKLTLVN